MLLLLPVIVLAALRNADPRTRRYCLTLLASLFFQRARVNWTNLLLILVFTHLALAEARNVAVWCIVISPLLVSCC